MKEVRVRSVIPIYTAAGVWLVYAMLFPLYKLWHFIVCGLLTFFIFLLMRKIFPGKIVKVEQPEAPPDTGNEALDQMITDGKAAIAQMRSLNDAIENPVITGQINELERLSTRIFEVVQENPKKLNEIRNFMNYYLPTTIKLLTTYENMTHQGIAGENVETTKDNIENVMETIVAVYRKRLDSLFEAEAMDISADIKVLETMMAKDGLSEKYGIKKENDNV